MPIRWTFEELRKILGVPTAVDFRYHCECVEINDRLKRKDYLEAVMLNGEDDETGMATDNRRE